MIDGKILSLQEKWELCKQHYESAYRHPLTNEPIRFTRTPEPSDILLLYDSMRQLHQSEKRHEFKKKQLEEYLESTKS